MKPGGAAATDGLAAAALAAVGWLTEFGDAGPDTVAMEEGPDSIPSGGNDSDVVDRAPASLDEVCGRTFSVDWATPAF